jgi:hypothetical protein
MKPLFEEYKKLWSVQDTVRVVYPFKARNTILDLISRGFRPKVYSPGPVGPGGGHQLDYWDEVSIGIIDSLIRSGVRYRDLMLDKRERPAASPIKLHRFNEQKGSVLYQPVDSWEDRSIQRYLEEHSSFVIAFIEFRRSPGPPIFFSEKAMKDPAKRLSYTEEIRDIFFAPETAEEDYWSRHAPGFSDLERVLSIRCRHWHNFVGHRLQLFT